MVALLAAEVVVDMATVGKVTMDLVMTEAISGAVEATKSDNYDNPPSHSGPTKGGNCGGRGSGLVLLANILSKRAVKVVVVPAATVAKAVAEGFNNC